MPEPLVCAIIVDYYTRDRTLELVADLQLQEVVKHTVIVDNTGDQRYNRDWVGEHLGTDSVRVVTAGERQGFGAGVNLGVRLASTDCEFLLVLNSDLRIIRGSISFLLQRLKQEAQLGAVGPLLLDEHGVEQRDAAGRLPDLQPGNGANWITGACFMMRSAVWAKLDGFDEAFDMYWEDVDLCRRLYGQGLGVEVEPNLVLLHASGGSDSSAASRYAKARVSRHLYFRKWGVSRRRTYLALVLSRLKLIVLRARENA